MTINAVAFEIVGGVDAGQRLVEALTLHSHVANIGDVLADLEQGLTAAKS